MRGGFVVDGASEVDPLVAEGPLQPVMNLRPATNTQRVLIVQNAVLLAADLETGRIGPWENGMPMAVPMVSLPFSLSGIALLQVQVVRDGNPSAVDVTLASLMSGAQVIDIVETTGGELVVRSGSQTFAAGPIGESPAVVVDVSPVGVGELRVSVRNAETLTATHTELAVPNRDALVLTIGGPTSEVAGRTGRRRQMPAHVDVVPEAAPANGARSAASGVRKKVGALKRRVL